MLGSAAIIGAGLGGLATAIRLRASGMDVTVVEARDRPGGLASSWVQDGYHFDDGPSVVTDLDGFRELWKVARSDMLADITLLPVEPQWRFLWPDGAQFNFFGDDDRLHSEIGRVNPADNAGWRAFLDHATASFNDGHIRLADELLSSARAQIGSMPHLSRAQAWRSLHAMVSRHLRDEHLREAVSFPALLSGGNPYNISALWALNHKIVHDRGAVYPKGGMGKLIDALADLFTRLGGRLVLGDAVVEVETLGNRATGVRTQSGAQIPADVVVNNGDVVHGYRDLLRSQRGAARTADALSRKAHGPSFFTLYMGVRGTWQGVAHRTVLMSVRHAGQMKDVFDLGVLSEDITLILNHPSITDPGLAPEGHSVFSALVPVPHLGNSPIDWGYIGPIMEARVMNVLEQRLIPGLAERVTLKAIRTPQYYADHFNAHLGSPFGIEPKRTRTGLFRVPHRDKVIRNLYFTGAATYPGPGIAGVLTSAKTTASLILAA